MYTESILDSVKKMLGIDSEYDVFDFDLIMHINSVFFVLQQLGVGPENGFKITGEEDTWDEFLTDEKNFEAVKSYVYLKVRLIFDPPLNSSVIESINRQIAELEWRLNVQGDTEHVGV